MKTGAHIYGCKVYICVFYLQKPYESFGMSIAGGKGPMCGDMPVYINDLISDGIVAQTKQIQVRNHAYSCVKILRHCLQLLVI